MSIAAYEQYSNWKIADTSEVVFAGGFQFAYKQELAQVIVHFYKHGTGSGSEQFRCKLYADIDMTKLVATGDWFALSGITDLSQYWRGRAGLEFSSKPWVDTSKTYYIGIETTGYTRNDFTFYIGFLVDDPSPINSTSTAVGLAVELIGYRSKYDA